MISKKAAIEVSATAIVTIILAFVFLGLAITFVRNIIGQSESTVDDFFASLGVTAYADASNPLVFPERATVRVGGNADFGIRVFNPSHQPLIDAKPVIRQCVSSQGDPIEDDGSTSHYLSFVTTTETIESGAEQAFRGSIRATEEVRDFLSGTSELFICSIAIRAKIDGTEQIVSEIQPMQVRVTVTT